MRYKMKIVLGVLWIAQRWKDENGKKKLKVCTVLPLWFVPVFFSSWQRMNCLLFNLFLH